MKDCPTCWRCCCCRPDLLELKANPNKLARGAVVEAKLDRGRGPVSTVLVQEGTLKVGDPIFAGPHHGRVRAMIDDQGRKVDVGDAIHAGGNPGASGSTASR